MVLAGDPQNAGDAVQLRDDHRDGRPLTDPQVSADRRVTLGRFSRSVANNETSQQMKVRTLTVPETDNRAGVPDTTAAAARRQPLRPMVQLTPGTGEVPVVRPAVAGGGQDVRVADDGREGRASRTGAGRW